MFFLLLCFFEEPIIAAVAVAAFYAWSGVLRMLADHHMQSQSKMTNLVVIWTFVDFGL